MQPFGDGDKTCWHPVAYYSRKLQGAELNWPTHDQELLAVLEASRHWRQYLFSVKTTTTVYTDHNNLKYFLTTKKLSPR